MRDDEPATAPCLDCSSVAGSVVIFKAVVDVFDSAEDILVDWLLLTESWNERILTIVMMKMMWMKMMIVIVELEVFDEPL